MSETKPSPRAIKDAELTQTLSRGLTIINTLAEAEKPLGVSEIARRVGVHKSSVHRLLRTMVEYRYLEQHESTSQYWLGPQLSRLGQIASLHLELPKRARVHVERLSKLTGETTNLVKFHNETCLYLISIQTEQSIGTIARAPGSTDPLYCTAAGQAMLAYLPTRRAENLLQRVPLQAHTKNTLTHIDTILSRLETARSQGYAVDDGENDENVRCIGSPVFDQHCDVIGAVSISGPEFRVTDDFIARMAPAVIACAIDIAEAVGFPAGENPLHRLLSPKESKHSKKEGSRRELRN